MNLPKVLSIDDSMEIQRMYKKMFGEKVVFVIATSHDDARYQFNKHNGKFDAIIMDGSLKQGRDYDTNGLMSEFRPKFKGLMVAASSDPHFCLALMRHGCDVSVEGDKRKAPELVLKRLA